jgi:hypothetical protein
VGQRDSEGAATVVNGAVVRAGVSEAVQRRQQGSKTSAVGRADWSYEEGRHESRREEREGHRNCMLRESPLRKASLQS